MTSYPASIATEPESFKERIKIGGESTFRAEDSSLSGAICNCKGVSCLLPSDITRLVKIHEDHESDEDWIDLSIK